MGDKAKIKRYQQAFEDFFNDGGTYGILTGMTPELSEQMYTLAYHSYQSGKYEEAAKIFKVLTLLDHYEVKYFLGLGACWQGLEEYQLAIDVYSCISYIDIKEPRAPFHAAQCYMKLNETEKAISGFYLAEQLTRNNKNYKEMNIDCNEILCLLQQNKEQA